MSAEAPIEEAEPKYTDKFARPGLRGLYAYVRTPAAFLETVIPEAAHWSSIGETETYTEEYTEQVVDEETGEITDVVKTREAERPLMVPDPEDSTGTVMIQAMRQKTIAEYVLARQTSVDGSEVVFPLAAMQAVKYRQKPVSEKDITDWVTLLPAYGIPLENVMNLQEYRELLATPEWGGEENNES